MRITLLTIAALLLFSCTGQSFEMVQVKGELKQWHKITLEIRGPESSESAMDNPFLDHKLDVTFSQGEKSVTVPGFYAADGAAAESSAEEGPVWKAHFRPDTEGVWDYSIRFRKGKMIAILDGEPEGEAMEADGCRGSITVAVSDKQAPDFRALGRVVNAGKGYLKTQGNDKLWIKNGADSPENFLGYKDFDQTYRFSLKKEFRMGEANPDEGLHKYEAHTADWKDGDPTWKEAKGRSMIGAVNYLHASGMNSIYMLTMNILGDGKDVWPYTAYTERTRFDCSKLEQWEIVFDHMESLGMMCHFVLQETENEVLLDNGHTDVHRRLYLREMIARFGHHLAVTWNLGEENGVHDWTPVGQSDGQRKAMARYIKQTDPWNNPVVLHTHSNDHHQDLYLYPLIGKAVIDGPSMQIANPFKVHERMLKWITESEETGERWYVSLDEIGQHWKGVMPDSHDPEHDTVRHQCLWGSLMAGGAGVEWYFGYKYPHNDLGLEDFRSRDLWWKQSTIATQFISHLPLEEMSSCDDLLSGAKDGYCLAKEGELYVLYLPKGTRAAGLQTELPEGIQLHWFDPRNGGELQQSALTSLSGKGPHSLGPPPSDQDQDWVVVLGHKP